MQDDAGPYRVGTVIDIRQHDAKHEGWDKRSQVEMRGGEDGRTQQHGAHPAVFFAEALEEEAPKEYFLHERRDNDCGKDKPHRGIKRTENIEDRLPLRIDPKGSDDQVVHEDNPITAEQHTTPDAHGAPVEFSEADMLPRYAFPCQNHDHRQDVCQFGEDDQCALRELLPRFSIYQQEESQVDQDQQKNADLALHSRPGNGIILRFVSTRLRISR